MATLTLQLATVQSNLTPTPFTTPDAEATNTPVNANQAQGALVALDTVTLAAQTAQGQGAAQNQQDGQQNGQQAVEFQSSPAFAAAAALFAGAISTISQNGNNATATQAASGSGSSANGKSTLAGIANTAKQPTASQPDLAQTQKQQLQQLDQTLRQLGIDPQSISVFNQLAMLFYSSNPSDLQQFVRQVQLAAQKVLQQGTATSGAESQTASQASSASGDAAASSAARAAANGAAQPADGSPQTTADSGNPSNAVAQQFQELQFAVAAVGGQVQLPTPTSAPSPPEKSPDKSLDVTL